ncbi:TolB family protein [Pseudomarimonas arenosa]|uniref:PD40 domain-containing protein n=1 Tax=Pseudomarimonas arenosa TaxID=2774145 RepID=A0AAW3ZW53_9GAMM|nr:PD40 domain-containing protein [Pseudomarimonas arenosa]MBD8528251.1 PD40 domain-containing protein [Pseudomarimonas arenosa]
MKFHRNAMPIAVGLLGACISGSVLAADLAYLAHDGLYWQAAIMADDGANARLITRSAGDKTRLSWYPDGQHLLLNKADGSVVRVAIEDGSEQAIDMPLPGVLDAVVSPDGQQIAFSLSAAGVADANHIWRFTPPKGAVKQVTRMTTMQHEPAWSRDGTALYFLSGGGGQVHDVQRVDLASGNVEQLTGGSLYNFDVDEGPNGQIVYSSNRSGNYEIWVQTGSGQPQRLTDHPALDSRPAWSVDGEHIAFESARGGAMHVWRMAKDGTDVTRISPEAQLARHPAWRPSGAQQ